MTALPWQYLPYDVSVMAEDYSTLPPEIGIPLTIVCGILITALGIWKMQQQTKLKRTCTVATTATVTSIICTETTSTDSDNNKSDSEDNITYVYYPVFEYQAADTKITRQSSIGTGNPRFSVGQELKLFYDPADAYSFYVPEDTASSRFGIWLLVMGVFTIIIGFLIPILS